jgi:hypothetical protein
MVIVALTIVEYAFYGVTATASELWQDFMRL